MFWGLVEILDLSGRVYGLLIFFLLVLIVYVIGGYGIEIK